MSTWIQLVDFMCPACPNSKKHDWVCAKDKTSMWLNELGKMKCLDGTHESDVITWKWNCDSEWHNGECLKADRESFVFAFSQAVQLADKAGPQWVSKHIYKLSHQFEGRRLKIETNEYKTITSRSSNA